MSNSKEQDINPAIAYSIVMKMLKEKMNDEMTEENRRAWETWDYLYELSYNECTHKDLDGNSSWKYPFEDLGINRKNCDYCPRN